MVKIKKTTTRKILSLAIASVFVGVANANNLTIPQHRTLSVDVGALDKNKNQNIIYNLVVTDANGNPVNTGYFIDNDNPNSSFIGVIDKTAKQGIVKNIKYKPGSETPPGEYFVELKATDGTTTLTSPKKSFTVTKSEQWIDFLHSNCTSLSQYTGYTVSGQNDKYSKSGINFEAYLLSEFNNRTILSMLSGGSVGVGSSTVTCNKTTPVIMPTENNLSNPHLTFSFTGSGFNELTGLSGMTNVKNLKINNTSIANVNGLSSIRTGIIDLRNNSLLTDVTGIQDFNTGSVYFDPDRVYATKSPFNSPVCSNIITGPVKMLGSRQFQYNICETDPAKLDDLTVVKYFNNYCGKNYLYAEKNFVLNDTVAISCSDGANANFSPVLTTLPVSITFNNSTSGLSGLSNLQSVTGFLNIINGQLVNLNDLSNLTTTTNGITINNSTTLTSLSGLEGLTSVGTGTIDIFNNPLLEDLTGIANIASNAKIRGDNRKEYTFRMPANSPLCTNLYTTPANVISTNSVMDFCEVPVGKENTSKFLQFFNKNCLKNYKVPDIALFENDTSTTSCTYTGSTADIPPEGTKYSGSLNFTDSELSDLNMLSNITEITGYLNLRRNENITTLQPLSKLKKVNELWMGHVSGADGSNLLTSLDGLESLESAKIYLYGWDSYFGRSLGMSNLTSVYGIRNLKTGIVNFQGADTLFEKYMQVKAPANSSLCSNIKLNNIILEGNAAYYNICESLPEEAEILKTFDYFKNYCNVLIPQSDLSIFSSKTTSYTCNTDLQTESNYSAEGALINWSTNGIRLTGDKTTDIFKKVETIAGYINLRGRSNITDLTEFGSIKTVGGTYQAYSMPNLTSLNGLQNFTGNLKLNAYYNPLLNDVSALSNVVQGDIYLDGRDFGVKNASNSPFCQAIFTEQVKINPGLNNWYGNVCELDPVQKDAYDATLWFRDNCNSKAYYSYPSVAAIEGKSSHACTFGQAMNFAPVVTKLKEVNFSSIKSVNDFGTSLSNLTEVIGLNFTSNTSNTANGFDNVNFINNLTKATGYLYLNSSNGKLNNISGLSKLTEVGSLHIYSAIVDNVSPLANINKSSSIYLEKKNYAQKIPANSAFCSNINNTVKLSTHSFAVESEVCEPALGKEGLYELSQKIRSFNTSPNVPIYVSDFISNNGWNNTIITNSLNNFGDFFELSNMNGIQNLKQVKSIVFNNSGMTKIPNALSYIENVTDFSIINESSLSNILNANAIKNISGVLTYESNNLVTDFSMSNLLSSPTISIKSNSLVSVNLNNLTNSNLLTINGANLTTINLPNIDKLTTINIDASLLNNVNFGSKVLESTYVNILNSSFSNLNFLTNLKQDVDKQIIVKNNLNLTDVSALKDMDRITVLNLTGSSNNINLKPLSTSKISSFSLNPSEYSGKMNFDSYNCKVTLKDSLTRLNYCDKDPVITNQPYDLVNLAFVNGVVVLSGYGDFSFKLPVTDSNMNIVYTIKELSGKGITISVQNNGSYLTVNGNMPNDSFNYDDLTYSIYGQQTESGKSGSIEPVQLMTVSMLNPSIPVNASCNTIKLNGLSTGDGVYTLDYDGSGPLPSVQAYCDMTTDGGGWTLLSFVGTNGFPPVDNNVAKTNNCLLTANAYSNCSATSTYYINTGIKAKSYRKQFGTDINNDLVVEFGVYKDVKGLAYSGNKKDVDYFNHSYYVGNPSNKFLGFGTSYSGSGTDSVQGPYVFRVSDGNTFGGGTKAYSYYADGYGMNIGGWGKKSVIWVR